MKLTTQQIQDIDHHLKKGGIKYWDVRLEMIDHIASDMETIASGSLDFETAFKQSLKRLAWDKDLDEVNTKSWKTTNNIYRTKHYKEIWKLIKQPQWFLGFVLLYFGLAWLGNTYPLIAKPIYFVILFIPVIVYMVLAVKTWRLKLGRSVNMDYGSFYFGFGMLMIGTPLNLLPKAHIALWMPIVMTLY